MMGGSSRGGAAEQGSVVVAILKEDTLCGMYRKELFELS